jgi:transcriptional regulator with XRE-family HTH domain
MALNTALKLAILKSGRTQFEIAKAAGLHYSVLSLLVRGHRDPTEEQQRALSKILRRPAADLFPNQQEVA